MFSWGIMRQFRMNSFGNEPGYRANAWSTAEIFYNEPECQGIRATNDSRGKERIRFKIRVRVVLAYDGIKKKFPFLYEVYLCVKSRRQLSQNMANTKRIHAMTKKELEAYDAALYQEWTGKILNWDDLQTFTEKMQWAKLYDDDPRKVVCADKIEVRTWVADRIGEEYLIPLIGTWDRYSDIDFSALPEQFAMKTNHGSGDVVVVQSKSRMSVTDKIDMRRKIETALKMDFGAYLCEMHYSKITPRILAEQYLVSEEGDLRDYKFQCFDGVVKYCYVDFDRFHQHKRNVYDLDWNLQDWNTGEYENYSGTIEKPANFEKMIAIAEKLSAGFSQVRVDLYNLHGRIYFGEMTFTSASGFRTFSSREADLMLGSIWNLPMDKSDS